MTRLSVIVLAAAVLGTGAERRIAAQSASAPSAGAFVKVDGSSLYYEECGTGPDGVLLIHDGVVHSAVWDDVWPAFCRRFHTIRYDRRGYGRSSATTTFYSETDDVAAILQRTHVSRATIVGSSHGGEISINFVLAHPDVVKRLVLVGAVVGGFPYSEHFVARVSGILAPLRKGDVTGALTAMANDRWVIAPGNDAPRKKLLDLLLANPQDLTHADQILPPKPALPRLDEIRVPTLILVGAEDIPDVHAHAGAIEAGIPRARRIVIAGTGHLMYLEKPDVFAQAVISFLDANPN